MTQRWGRITTPLALSYGEHAGIEATQSAEQEEHGRIGSGIIDRGRDIRDPNAALRAGLDVYLVISGALAQRQSLGVAFSLLDRRDLDEPRQGIIARYRPSLCGSNDH